MRVSPLLFLRYLGLVAGTAVGVVLGLALITVAAYVLKSSLDDVLHATARTIFPA